MPRRRRSTAVAAPSGTCRELRESAVHVSALDLRGDRDARRACKRSPPVRVEFAPESGTLETREGPVGYARGDALLTGSEGERWPVPRASFDASYEPVAPSRHGKPGSYRKRPLILWAKPMAEPFAVTLDCDRGTLRGKPGDWLVQYGPDNLSVVSGSSFSDTYELLD